METLQATRRRLTAAGIDYQSDGGGGFDLWRDGVRVGRVYSEAALMAWREEPITVIGVVMMNATEARETIEQIKVHLDGMRKLLLDLEEREGWKALGYGSWRECAAAEFGQSTAHVYRLLTAAKIEQAINSPIGEIAESHLRPLTALDTPDQQKAALDRADQLAGDAPRRAKHVQQAVEEINPHVPQPFGWICITCGTRQTQMREPNPSICTQCAIERMNARPAAPAPDADLIVGQRADPHQPDPKEPPAPTFEDDGAPHLPADFAQAHARAKKIDLLLSMNGFGEFALRNERGSGVDHYDWPSMLIHLDHMERAEASAERDRQQQQRRRGIEAQITAMADVDPRTQAASLLRQLAPLLAQIRTEDRDGLSEAIADLNQCGAGQEVAGWLRVGWALLDLEPDE